MVEVLLSQAGHIVTTAVDAYDALDKMNRESIDIIVTDAIMPGGFSGYDFVKTVKGDQRFKNIPVILLTGRREKRDIERGIACGVDDYIVKPLDPDIFANKVNSLLDNKNLPKTNFTDVATSIEASFTTSIKIVGVSEMGLTLQSEQPFHIISKIKIVSDFFGELGIDPPALRVVSCEPNGDDKYTTKVHYIGLTEGSLQPLRVWIRSRRLSNTG